MNKMNNKTYDTLKNIALFGAPIIAFLGSLVTIWAAIVTENPLVPAAITATLTAIDSLLGALVIAAKKIYDEKGGGDHA